MILSFRRQILHPERRQYEAVYVGGQTYSDSKLVNTLSELILGFVRAESANEYLCRCRGRVESSQQATPARR